MPFEHPVKMGASRAVRAAGGRQPPFAHVRVAKPVNYTGSTPPAGSLGTLRTPEKRCRIRRLRRSPAAFARTRPVDAPLGPARGSYTSRQCFANSGCSSRKPARCASRRCSWWRRCGPISCRARASRAGSVIVTQETATPVVGARVASYADAAKKAMPAVVNIYTSKEVRSRNPLADDPHVPPLLPRLRPRRVAAADEPRLRRDRRVGRLRAHQSSRDPGRRRHPARAVRRTPRERARARHRSRVGSRRAEGGRGEPARDHVRGRRSRCRSATSCSPSAIPSASATPSRWAS